MSIDEEKITDVYDRIKNLCKTKGISQIELCNICNINLHSHKNRIVKKVAPDVFDTLKIARFLGTSVEYLVTGEEKDIYKKKYDMLRSGMAHLIEETKKI